MHETPIDDLGISLLQHLPEPADIDAGLNRLEHAAKEAASQGSSLLITPECGMTGYDISEEHARRAEFTADGPTSRRIADIAQRHSIAILFGYMEKSGENRFNSIQLVDENGDTLLHYRKTHLWGDLDRQLFSAGDALAPVINFKGWRIGTLICYDVEFPETVRSLALGGAQLVLVPTALMHPYRFVADTMVRVRAAENQVYLAYANLVGAERNTVYEGCSTIVGPQGDELARAPSDKAALLHTTLAAASLNDIRRQLPYFQDRRPELYAPICEFGLRQKNS